MRTAGNYIITSKVNFTVSIIHKSNMFDNRYGEGNLYFSEEKVIKLLYNP